MTITAPVPGASSSQQGQTVTLSPNIPVQIQVPKDGVTLISESNSIITLGSDAYFAQNTVNLPAGASLPWPPGGVLYAVSTVATTLIVMQGLFNYWNPATIPTLPGANEVFGQSVTLNGIGAAFEQITVPTSARTLLIAIAGTPGATNPLLTSVSVQGVTSNYFYRVASPPYLQNVSPFVGHNTNYFLVVPINGAIDQQYNINVSGGIAQAGTVLNPFTIFYDASSFQENIFYNGTMLSTGNTVASVGSVPLLTGPARLLECSVEAISPGVVATLSINGTQVKRADSTAGSTVPFTASGTFPDNTIMPAQSALTLAAAGAAGLFAGGSINYAYP
jgi:hypothetical protein